METRAAWTAEGLRRQFAGCRIIARDRRADSAEVPSALAASSNLETRPWTAEIDRVHPSFRPACIDGWWSALDRPGELIEIDVVAGDGDGSWYRERVSYLNLLEHPDVGVVLVSYDRLGPANAPDERHSPDTARFDEAPWLLQELDDLGRVIRTIGTVDAIFGLPDHELVGREVLDFVHPDDRGAGIAMWLELLEGEGQTRTIEQRIVRPDGSEVWISSTVRNQLASAGHVLSVSHDISAERRRSADLRSREHALRFVTESVPVGVFQADELGRLVLTNERFREFFPGPDLDALAGRVEPAGRAELTSVLRTLGEHGGSRELRALLSDGRHVQLSIRALVDDEDPATGRWLVGTVDDVSTDVARSSELVAISERDPLTGIANRRGLSKALQRIVRADAPGAVVVFGDLDSFKQVNDRHGHAAGDAVLQEISARLRHAVRPADVVGRWGGDEFVIVCADVAPGAESELLTRLDDAVVAPIELSDGTRYTPAISFGAVRRRGAETDEDLLRRADTQMYEAKRRRHRR